MFAVAFPGYRGAPENQTAESASHTRAGNRGISQIRQRTAACHKGGLSPNGGIPSQKQGYACGCLDSRWPTIEVYHPATGRVTGREKLPDYESYRAPDRCRDALAAAMTALSGIQRPLLHSRNGRVDCVHVCPNILAVRRYRGSRRSLRAAGCVGVAEPCVLADSLFQVAYSCRLRGGNVDRSFRPSPFVADDHVLLEPVVDETRVEHRLRPGPLCVVRTVRWPPPMDANAGRLSPGIKMLLVTLKLVIFSG